jgi:hypothetical protein
MRKDHKHIYLYLTLACFLGIILIFIFDGYMGVYDTLLMDNGQYPQYIEADQWPKDDRDVYYPMMGVERGGRITFTYTIENHRFSEYTDVIDVSVFRNEEKLNDLHNETVTVGAFSEEELKWTLDAAGLVPSDFPDEQSYRIDVVINRGEIERKVLVDIYPSPVIPKR